MAMLSRNLARFRLVTFDLTDTLLRFTRAPEEQYALTAKQFGCKNVDESKLKDNFKAQFKYMIETYPNFGKSSGLQWQDWWRTLVINIFKASKSNIDDKTLIKIADSLIIEYETKNCWCKIDKADEVINKIKSAQKIIGIISNSDPRVSKIMKDVCLPQFDFIMTSYEVNVTKPNPIIFDKALAQYKKENIQPKEALHVGNTFQTDYTGAVNAGWTSVLISSKDESGVKLKFNNLDEFLYALEQTEITW